MWTAVLGLVILIFAAFISNVTRRKQVRNGKQANFEKLVGTEKK